MGKLTIQEIAKVLTEKNGLEQRQANAFATEFFALVQERLQQGEQVKVKGLGTWKIINVEARESISVRTGERVIIGGHSKISFTPDATLKELVNKPFSQFETVVLNEGVEFDDLKDDLTEEELREVDAMDVREADVANVQIDTPEPQAEEDFGEQDNIALTQWQNAEADIVAEPEVLSPQAVEPEPEPVFEVEAENELITEDEQPQIQPYQQVQEQEQVLASATVPVTPLMEATEQETEGESVIGDTENVLIQDDGQDVPEDDGQNVVEDDGQEVVEDDENETVSEEKTSSWGKWLIAALGVLALMAISAFGGYYYGAHQQMQVVPDTVVVTDTLFLPEQPDSIEADEVGMQEKTAEQPEETDTPQEKATQESTEKTTQKSLEKTAPAEGADPYAAKDERVRLGAYRIVGLDHEVKVLPGQTFYSICRAHLGPDMACYVEVYNDLPQNPNIKAGQVIKIPKLELKKRRKE